MWKMLVGAALGLAGAYWGPADAAPPYPQSPLITGMAWDVGSCRWTAQGSDIWPVTLAAEAAGDPSITAWGDGRFGCTEKAYRTCGSKAHTASGREAELLTIAC